MIIKMVNIIETMNNSSFLIFFNYSFLRFLHRFHLSRSVYFLTFEFRDFGLEFLNTLKDFL
jgi:hypothetical protein